MGLLFFNICEQNSFDEIEIMHKKILRAKDVDSVPLVIAGNKCDLRDPTNDKQVSISKAEERARNWKCRYFETSAKEKINNEECFYQVVREIRKSEIGKKKEIGKSGRRCSILQTMATGYRLSFQSVKIRRKF